MTDEELHVVNLAIRQVAIGATLGAVHPMGASMAIALSDVAREMGRTTGWSAEDCQRAINEAVDLCGMERADAERIARAGFNPVFISRFAEKIKSETPKAG